MRTSFTDLFYADKGMKNMAKYCPECGTATERKLVSGRKRDACPACNFIQFSKTKIGVGALVFRSESVLLVQRNIEPHDFWTLPSGYQEENETLEMAVTREVWEETGIKVTPRGIVFVRNMMEHFAIDMYSVFLCDTDYDVMPVVHDHESIAVQFVSTGNFDNMDIEPDSRWFVETYLALKPKLATLMSNPFSHPSLQIYSAHDVDTSRIKGAL